MDVLIVAAIIAILSIILKFLFGANLKKLKKITENEKLDKVIEKYPDNTEVCEWFLKKLKNEKVKIQEDEQSDASLYLVVGNTIKIGKIGQSFTRIQTIAHECIHSIQSKKLLIANFILSNLYFLYFIVMVFLRFGKNEIIVENQSIILFSFMALGLCFYAIRTYLENDAMIKARYLAKQYLEEQKISNEKEIDEIIESYDKMNDIGIKCVNYNIFLIVTVIIVLFSIICAAR